MGGQKRTHKKVQEEVGRSFVGTSLGVVAQSLPGTVAQESHRATIAPGTILRGTPAQIGGGRGGGGPCTRTTKRTTKATKQTKALGQLAECFEEVGIAVSSFDVQAGQRMRGRRQKKKKQRSFTWHKKCYKYKNKKYLWYMLTC